MSRVNVKCPVCGRENEGVDPEETYGCVECVGCGSDFIAVEYFASIRRGMQARLNALELIMRVSARAQEGIL